jgi:hypothetical protein
MTACHADCEPEQHGRFERLFRRFDDVLRAGADYRVGWRTDQDFSVFRIQVNLFPFLKRVEELLRMQRDFLLLNSVRGRAIRDARSGLLRRQRGF